MNLFLKESSAQVILSMEETPVKLLSILLSTGRRSLMSHMLSDDLVFTCTTQEVCFAVGLGFALQECFRLFSEKCFCGGCGVPCHVLFPSYFSVFTIK